VVRQGARHKGQESDVQQHHPSVPRMSPVRHIERAAWESGKAACARGLGCNAQRSLTVLALGQDFRRYEESFNRENIHVECRRFTLSLPIVQTNAALECVDICHFL
jgi:hypothetical protein